MTASAPPSRLKIGVWFEWPDGDVSNAGAIARRIALLAVGAAQSKACVLHVAAPDALAGVLRARMTEIAGAEGEDWVLHSPREIAASAAAAAAAAADVAAAAAEAAAVTAQAAAEAFAAIQSEAMAMQSQIATLSQPTPRGRRDVLRPRLHADRERERLNALEQAQALEAARARIREQERKVHMDRLRETQLRAEEAAEQARLAAVRAEDLADVSAAAFAEAVSQSLGVAGWLAAAPDYADAAALSRPRAVILADGTPAAWPLGWPDADWAPGKPAAVWRERARRLLELGDPVIVATRSLAESEGVRALGLDAARLRPAPMAPVDLSPLAAPDRRAAGERLRGELAHAENRYLRGFPFEDVRYLAAWSEGSPGLNLRILAEAMRLLIQRDLMPIKVFVASPGGAPEQEVWREIGERGLHHDLIPMPVLSTPALAALIQGAELSLCTAPSAAGGTLIGWSQAISLGVPSLVCDGPEVRETLAHADMADAVFDPYDAEALAARIKAALAERTALRDRQVRVLRSMERTWADVLDDHIAAIGAGART